MVSHLIYPIDVFIDQVLYTPYFLYPNVVQEKPALRKRYRPNRTVSAYIVRSQSFYSLWKLRSAATLEARIAGEVCYAAS